MTSIDHTVQHQYIVSTHDSTTLGQKGLLFPNDVKMINTVPIPIMILGDPAYPLLQRVMKPFSDNGRLSRSQHILNYRLSKARIITENVLVV